jgi:hypothetical protein
VFDVVLPAVVADLRLDEVTVDVDYANTGGNVALDIRLQQAPLALCTAVPSAAGLAAWQTAVPAAASDGGRYRFAGPQIAALVQPTSGRLRLLLHASQKHFLTMGQNGDRSNRWRLNSLRVAVAGNLPQADQSRRF